MIKHNQTGFSIVELLITIVFLGMAIVGLSTLFLAVHQIQLNTAYVNHANRAGMRQIETLRNNQYNSLEDGQIIDFSDELPSMMPTGSQATAIISEPTPGVKRVDISVQYQSGQRQQEVKLSSLIGLIGITQ